MPIRFRKSIKIAPGIKLNLSKGGISTSIGGAGHSVNFSSKGTRSTVGLPGTGLSYTSGSSRQTSSSGSGCCLFGPIQFIFRIISSLFAVIFKWISALWKFSTATPERKRISLIISAVLILFTGFCFCVSTAINWISVTPTPTIDVAAVQTSVMQTMIADVTASAPTLTPVPSFTFTPKPTSTITQTLPPTATPTFTPIPTQPPAQPTYPPGVTALCKDGTYSYSKHVSGTCAGHSGVAVWINKP